MMRAADMDAGDPGFLASNDDGKIMQMENYVV